MLANAHHGEGASRRVAATGNLERAGSVEDALVVDIGLDGLGAGRGG
jgi:hypothetical protein